MLNDEFKTKIICGYIMISFILSTIFLVIASKTDSILFTSIGLILLAPIILYLFKIEYDLFYI